MTADPTHDLKMISLLLADPSHAQKIAALHHILFSAAVQTSEIQEMLADPSALSLAATSNGAKNLVGYVIGRVAGDDAEILWIGVDGPWRRRGVGLHLLQGFERAAKNAGLPRVVFEVASDNAAALALYERAGYSPVGARPKYYERRDGTRCDAVILARDIAAPEEPKV